MLVIVVESPLTPTPLELAFEPGERIVIGRGPDSQVQLPDASVSLRHASIRPAGGGYAIVDEGSTNGTFVNAVRLAPGVERALAEADEIQVGRARLRLELRPASAGKGVSFSTQDIALAMVQGALISSGSAVVPRLSVIAGPDRGLELVLREERSYVLGRDLGVDLRLKDEDASRRHTRVVRKGSRLWVIDLGSRNGTRLDGRTLSPNVPEVWSDTLVLELGRNQLAIEDPVSSALRSVEQLADEKLGAPLIDAYGSTRALVAGAPERAGRSRTGGRGSGEGGAFSTVSEPKGVLSLSTSSSSSAPSAPIEVLRFRESDPPRRSQERRSRWSLLDAMVVSIAVVTIAVSVLALAWFLAG